MFNNSVVTTPFRIVDFRRIQVVHFTHPFDVCFLEDESDVLLESCFLEMYGKFKVKKVFRFFLFVVHLLIRTGNEFSPIKQCLF